uniref:Single domain-containing protein n=1 Tax=Trichuris muris TaxID=70415 RepID=A0A5S6Q879_TRIMR
MSPIRLWHFLPAIVVIVLHHVERCQAQELNDPSRNYIEGRLGNRRIWWCPSGYGYLSFCPQPTDWDNYNWCCTWPYMGTWKPSCCPFAIPTGAVVAVIIAGVVFTAVIIALSCWCCYCCPLYKQLYEY